MDINLELNRLLQYGVQKGLIHESDHLYVQNRLINYLMLPSFTKVNIQETLDEPSIILENIMDYGFEHNVFKNDSQGMRDIIGSELMNFLLDRPSNIINKFSTLYQESSVKATDYFYHLSQDSYYIKKARIAKNIVFSSNTKYGEIDITINLAKPEKDPKDIIASKNKVKTGYPTCLLCVENEGFQGHSSHPGRSNHRVIPLSLSKEEFIFQYSPYVYFNEHVIVIKRSHEPMEMTKKTFQRLLDFVTLFPHYFLGSNACKPIVGGSILAHEHYQGGRYQFPIERAETIKTYQLKQFSNTTIQIVKWPLSVIRLSSNNKEELIEACEFFRLKWDQYTDESAHIFEETYERHNAITPICRYRNDKFEFDLALRNNLVTEEFPLGYFHPHPDVHHIKKENIGLIEVMGLAVLPGRLKNELYNIKTCLQTNEVLPDSIKHHSEWFEYLKNNYNGSDINEYINVEVTKKFARVLEDAGVFKQTDIGIKAFNKFMIGCGCVEL